MSVEYLKRFFDVAYPDMTVRSVFEIGSRDCAQAKELSKEWPSASIVAFEPNPNTLPLCYNEASKNWKIMVVPCAVSMQSKMLTFYQSKTQNQGYSSLYKPSGKYDCVEHMPCNEIQVNAVRIDDFIEFTNHIPPEVMWMDCQGSELSVLMSMSKSHMSNLKAIWTEYLLDEMYYGVPLYNQLDGFLKDQGYKNVYKQDVVFNGKPWFGDACYVR